MRIKHPFRRLPLGHGGLNARWCQRTTSFHLHREGAEFVYREESLILAEVREDVLNLGQLLPVFRVVAGQHDLRRLPPEPACADDLTDD